jgi:hypothetical protein
MKDSFLLAEKTRLSLVCGLSSLGAAPVRQADFDRFAAATDDYQMKVDPTFIHNLVLCPRRDEGEVARPKLVSFRLLIVAFWLGKESPVTRYCV